MRIHITKAGYPRVVRPINDDGVARLCFGLAGGGWLESQTAEAMELQQQLMNGHIITAKDGTIWRLEQ